MTREEATAYWKQRSEYIHNWLEENEDVDFIGEYVEAIDTAIEALSAEAVQGEWTYLSGSKGSYMTISCPICGSTFDDVAEWKYNYCPNCGARMKGADDE